MISIRKFMAVIALSVIFGTGTTFSASENFESGDLLKYSWSLNGDDNWSVTTENPYSGNYSAESPLLNDNEKASLEKMIYVDRSSYIQFFFSVESEENADYLSFYVDDQLRGAWSGVIDYSASYHLLPPGPHHLKWEYQKNASDSEFSDTSWLDDVQFPDTTTQIALDGFETSDLSHFNWSTTGSSGKEWFVQNNFPHNGLFAATSPDLKNNENSQLYVRKYCKDGIVSFWFALDSEQNFDFLHFYVDGTLESSWSGQIDYTRRTYPVSAGEHEFKWQYKKDFSISTERDAAWVDDIFFPVPFVTVENFESGQFTKHLWNETRTPAWQVVTNHPREGLYSASPPPLLPGKTADMEANMFCDQGILSFSLSVDSEKDTDQLSFYIDNTLQGTWSGAIGYTTQTFPISRGRHDFKWEYNKNEEIDSGFHTCWIDDIRFPGRIDSDFDNLPDYWEYDNFSGLHQDAQSDYDRDLLLDIEEFENKTNPRSMDTDHDGMPDGFEVTNRLNPLLKDMYGDMDGDLFSNITEYLNGTDPNDSGETPEGFSDIEDFETGDLSNYDWETPGTEGWDIIANTPHSGSFAAGSPPLENDENASIETVLYCQESDVNFWYQVDSEQGGDFLSFYINDELRGSWSGAIDYTQTTIEVKHGPNQFKWVYQKNGSINDGEDTASIDDIRFPVSDIPVVVEDFESNDFSHLSWQLSGDHLWQPTNENAYSGIFSALSPPLDNDEKASMQTDIFCEDGLMSFWYSVDSEAKSDRLLFYIDEKLEGSWSGKIDYTRSTYPLTYGNHSFRWTYEKDGSGAYGQDAAWVDNIYFPGVLETDINGDGDVDGMDLIIFSDTLEKDARKEKLLDPFAETFGRKL